MKVKDLKKMLDNLDPNAEVACEDKISRDIYSFDAIMGCYTMNVSGNGDTIVFYSR